MLPPPPPSGNALDLYLNKAANITTRLTNYRWYTYLIRTHYSLKILDPSPDEVGRRLWRSLGCPSVRISFSEQISETCGGISLILHTHTSLGGRWLWNLTYLNSRRSAMINMPDIWPHFVSGADLWKPIGDFFYIAHTHPLIRGCGCAFWGFVKFNLLKSPTIGHN